MAWDLTEDTISWQTAPVAGLQSVSVLVPREDGKLWALSGSNSLFLFDPQSRTVVQTVEITGPGGWTGTPALAPGQDGLLYGSTGSGNIFTLNPETGGHQLITSGRYVLPHTDGRLYFSRGPELFRATLTRGGRAGGCDEPLG